MDKKLSFGELIQFSFSTTIKKLRSFSIGFLMIFGVFIIAFGSLVYLSIAFDTVGSYFSLLAPLSLLKNGQITSLFIGSIVAYMVTITGMSFGRGYNVILGLDVLKGRNRSILERIKCVANRLPSLLMYHFMMFVIILFANLPIILDLVEAYNFWLLIYLLLSYMMMIVISTFMTLTSTFILEDEVNALEGMKKSFNAIKPNFARTILYFALVGLVFSVIAFQLILVIVAIDMGLLGSGIFQLALIILATLLFLVALLLMMSVWTCLRVNLYKQLYLD